jgi:hypothetical protein
MSISLVKANFAIGTFSIAVGSSDTNISLHTNEYLLFPSSGDFIAVIWRRGYNTPQSDPDREIVKATISGVTFNIIRAQEGTTAQAFSIDDNFALIVTKGVFDDLELEIVNKLSKVITDPGASGAIPITTSGHCSIVTTAGQTRTLAAPTFAGQEMLLSFKTDGGDCVITVATGINVAGNTTITMDVAGQAIGLVAIDVGSNIRWRVNFNDGCTLGP